MAIHHTLTKKAEKNGIILTEFDGGVEAHSPNYGIRTQSETAKGALDDAIERIAQRQADDAAFGAEYDTGKEEVPNTGSMGGYASTYDAPQQFDTVAEAMDALNKDDELVVEDDYDEGDDEFTEEERDEDPRFHPEHIADNMGEPDAPEHPAEYIEGGVAYKAGVLTADCPYNVESEDEAEQERANQWYEGWDAAADAAEAESEKEPSGSVVSAKYRAKYAEAGHPTHCGDELAEFLVATTNNEKGTNLELFEVICSLNGVDTSKYKRDGIGWQGRIRMTGRNLLAKKVYLSNGVLFLPEELGTTKTLSAEWMAGQRFKMPKADQ